MGRPEFENQTTISATTSKRIKFVEQSTVLPLNPSTYERLTLYSAPNTVSRVMNLDMRFMAIPGQISGMRQMIVDNYSSVRSLGTIYAEATGDYGSQFLFGTGRFYTGGDRTGAGVSTIPDPVSIPSTLRDIYFDEVIGVAFVFRHTHTAAVTAERKFSVFLQEETVKR